MVWHGMAWYGMLCMYVNAPQPILGWCPIVGYVDEHNSNNWAFCPVDIYIYSYISICLYLCIYIYLYPYFFIYTDLYLIFQDLNVGYKPTNISLGAPAIATVVSCNFCRTSQTKLSESQVPFDSARRLGRYGAT